ncbi:MAG TPA: START domain-containing protein [Thermoanaerobaculia bacterium]|nr:START domain-containing protein [Thermoanaerobaculia bacterium]
MTPGLASVRNALRRLIGAVLLLTAVGKLLDVAGFARVIGTYQVFSDRLLLPLAILVPAAELLLAVWLFSGRRPFAAAMVALAMHVAYAAWSAAAVERGLKLSNCGCFGVFLPRALGWSTVVEDLVMVFLCGGLAALCRPALTRRLGAAACLFLAGALVRGEAPPDSAFAPWFVSRGVSVEIARSPGGPPWIRGRGEIPAPAAKVAAVLSDFRRYRDLFAPAVKKADVLESHAGGARVHFVWPYPFPYSNRDAVVRYESAEENGAWRISWRADARPGDPAQGTRIERVEGETRIEPAGPEACRVTYTYFGDLGGKFPGWAQEKAWREEPVQYFRAIRRRLGLPDLPAADR